MEDALYKLCRRLKLGTNIVDNAKAIKKENNIEFLLELFTMEIENRELKRKNVFIKQAKFDLIKTFEDYTFEDIKIPKSITPNELMDSSFVGKKENLILYGNVGSGKTHLAIAAGIAACNNGKKVRFYRTASLVNELVEAKKQGNIVKLLKSIEKCDLLICDEWGYVPVDTNGAKLLFGVIADCYERKSLIITTNLEFTKWNEVFYDEKLTAAIIDRIIHHSHLLDFTGRDSMRLKNSLIKLK
ncbi:ATP-binding protein [Desulforamulus profundi]|uniref:ATP-binding protein n=1 Tax=Desulforamulus profundi TaxID=1383067 RepID=A0A2C6M8H1_9FIRM|nr:IS21-like element helper ATPase IstB [Desulforamulus profundi]PHJ38567.1 ATP-binding protein [Desulforamulus profundi]